MTFKQSKRLIDGIAALICLVLLLPLLGLLALIIRIHLGAPVFFIQSRIGLNSRSFRMIKFRTMTNEVGVDGNLLPVQARLTRLGKWLRSSSLDELPELWNVLIGDMSLIGPRPLLPKYLTRYTPAQARRHEIRPGITGWAQVNGRNSLAWEDKFNLDVWYVDNMSFRLDCQILLMTLQTVISRRGIDATPHATMREFMGTTTTNKVTEQ